MLAARLLFEGGQWKKIHLTVSQGHGLVVLLIHSPRQWEGAGYQFRGHLQGLGLIKSHQLLV
jgi:hypothetical protein